MQHWTEHSERREAVSGWTKRVITIVLVAMVVAAVASVLIMIANARRMAMKIYCGANVRGIHQGFVLFANNNQDILPLPSELDKAGATVAATDPTTKDTTAAIFATLITANYFGPEICISVAEVSPAIRLDADYQYKDPSTAVRPKEALWDPAFSADFTAPGGGNLSYAHTLPTGPRRKLWTNTFDDKQAVVGNRGPLVSRIVKGTSPEVSPEYNTASTSIKLHGRSKLWRGNIGYGDNHVDFISDTLWADAKDGRITYRDASKKPWSDVLFADEADDPSGLNNYLGIFTKAGPKPTDFTPIWD